MSPIAHHPDLSISLSKASTTLAGGKRKRDHFEHIPANSPNKIREDAYIEQLHQLFKDVLEILKSYDVSPSVLNHKIPSAPNDLPVVKKAKLASASEEKTVAQLVDANAYNSVDEFSKDLDNAVTAVVEDLESAAVDGETNDRQKPKYVPQSDVVRAMAFKQEFNNILLRELMQRPHLMNVGDVEGHKSPNAEGIFGPVLLQSGNECNEYDKDYSTVLTLFGGSGSGSGQPKQLFSSLRDTRGSEPFRAETMKGKSSEAGLPNGITFTKIVPVHSQGDQEKMEVPTIGKHFAPPPNVQPLNPPRQSRHTATRSSSVNWYNPVEIPTPTRPNRRDSYNTQPLTTGHWLTYNVAPSTKDLSSPESKRKQRDRALSFGEPQSELSEQTLAQHRQAKEDALFRSVYSGFAPDQDNGGALVPQQCKNRIWWKRVGEHRYHHSQSHSPQAPSYSFIDPSSTYNAQIPEDEPGMSIEEAVELWTPEEPPAEFSVEERPDKDPDVTRKGMEEMLNDISELLETLNSYQDVRNLSLANNARTNAGQNTQLTAMVGTPASPSPEELEIYNILQSQLSIMVSSLPPYALAKLDGRKLGKLNINTKIQVETKNYQGSLEEDEISTRGRQPAVSATVSYPSRTPTSTVGLAPRNNYLAATNTPAALSQRASHVPQTAPARAAAPSSYLPNPQYPTRAPPANQYYGNNGRSSYAAHRPTSATPDRYPYTGTQQQYSQSTGRPSYANGYNQYPHQNGTYGQGYPHSQQTSTSSRVAQPPYKQSSSRPTQSYNYTATPSAVGGSASPSKAAAQYASQVYANASSTPSQTRPGLYQHHSSQHSNQAPMSPQVNGSSSPQVQQKGNHDTAVELQRQKAQAAEAERRGSSTPQAANATAGLDNQKSAVQANGVMAVSSGG
ncbi:MAG: hypothetical protein Q9223_004902 [Gallowayella weberi]